MNVRKRGLALLMCICMIFTLLPFSVFAEDAENGNRGGAEGTAQPSVVYGQYDNNGTWTQKTGLTAVGEPYTNSATGADVTYSKTAVSKGNDTYDITLKIESKTSSTAPGASAIVLVIDISTSMYYCTECGNQVYHNEHCSKSTGTSGGPFNKHGSEVKTEDTRLYAAKNAAVNFVNSYKGNIENAGRYIQLVAFDGNAYIKLSDWIDVSVAANATEAIAAINDLTPTSEGNGTNLEQGLSKAKSLITSAPNGIAKDKKFAVVLTDGEPNRQGSDSSSWKIKSKTDTAAKNLKSAASVYTVCFGAESTWSNELRMYVGQYLSGTVASNPSNAFNANSAAELNKAFEVIFKSIEQGLDSGFTVTDPMGEFIQLDESSIKDATAKVNGNTITWTPTTGKVSETDGVKTYTYTLTYTVKLDTSADGFVDNKYYATNDVTTLAFKDGDENITRNFNVPGVKGETYTVTYNKGDHGTLNDQNGEGNVVHSKLQLNSKTPTAPEVTADDGYYFTGWEPTVAETVTGNATYTAQYKIKDDLSYTVHYYWNGTNDKVAEDKTVDSQTFNETVTETPVPVNGYTPVSADSKTITIGTGTNEITFYYYKNVTLTAEDRIVTYNGQEQTVNTGYDVVVKADNGKDFKLSGVEFRGVYASGTGKEVGEYAIDFVGETVGKTDTTAKYIVANTVKGTLTITPIDTVVVTITGNTDTKVYNGAEQSVTGYTVKISDPKYTEADFKFTGDPKASRTDVGTTPMGLNTDQFENNNKNFKNVTFVVEDGSLTITKRPLTIEGQSSEPITYDGQTHSFMKWWPVTPTDNTGLVSGHEVSGINYLLTGKDAGSYTGEFSGDAKIMSGEENVTENYSIEYTLGKMKIVPAERIAVKIIGNHKEVWYNGQEQSVSGFTFDVADNTVTVELKDGHYAIAKGTNVKTYYMGLKSDDFTINHKNYKEVSAEIVDGYLTIKRHYTPNPPITDKITVEITGNSDSVVYDGTEHSVKDYTVKISDSRYTEKDFTFSGKALASGVNAGAYEMGLKADQFKNTNARFTNVEFIIKADGVLTITQRPLTITAGSAEGIAPVTCDKYTVEGLATGDKVDSVKITGIQSEPGESPNVASDAVIKNAKGDDVTANYKITYVDGVLKAIEVLNKEIHFNYVIGYTDGTIRPNNDISRAEVATIFFRLLTDEAREQYTTTAGNFTDVKAGMWCNRAIATLTNMGIIKGYTDGSFQPNKSITRAELATIIARFAKLDVNNKTFSDINGHWAQKNIELAAGNGWINGYEDGTFRPNNNITRAETFAMINRVLDRQTESVSDLLPTSEMNMWSDNLNENAWYYKDVQEATNYHKCDRVGDSVYEKWTEKVPDIDWASYQI
ncbi:MAG: hypothetical protein BHW36_06605 [Firmicutes bacterium CAG:24053_14]|nr:MAG: hypothetical protein BHW36_06605 [Firmicutes bacterium CAG:24053_14]